MMSEGIPLPAVVIADEQTAGRGQWGRVWESSPGGLYLSMGIQPDVNIHPGQLTIISGWGIAHQLQLNGIDVRLKWPNDLLLQGGKLGGIKSETRMAGNSITKAVIGVGINWCNTVPPTGTNLKTLGASSVNNLEELAEVVVEGIFKGYQKYSQEGMTSIVTVYMELLESMGKKVMVNNSPGVVTGIDLMGHLRVELHSVGASVEISLPPTEVRLSYL